MAAVVLDASAALSWLSSDEQTPASRELAHEVARHGAVVPEIWHAEVTQLLLLAERRGRTTMGRVSEIVALLDELPIETEAGVPQRVRHEVLELARDRGLSTCDALYLDLAQRRGLPLATLDPALSRAARAVGVPVALGD
jgi:predicted nucleic acid-binding protein